MELELSATLVITIVTVIVSLMAFNNERLMGDLIFDPIRISNNRQYYRFITCGFIHADYMHLIFNMFSFYSFGRAVEYAFNGIFGEKGVYLFVFFYLSALYFSLVPTYRKHKHNRYYLSLGASGAVSAIIFASIPLAPVTGMTIFPFPFAIPGIIFGPLYLIFTAYLDKQGRDNINHSAHLWGALYGLFFIVATSYLVAHYPLIDNMIIQIRWWLAEKGIGNG